MSHRTLYIAAWTWMMILAPQASASELEQLRALVAEQERQIRQLEAENAQLRGDRPSRAARPLESGALQTVANAPIANPAAGQAGMGIYTVVPGDNLVRIGRNLGVSAQALAKANGMDANAIIHPGQKLKIPSSPAGSSIPVVHRTGASIPMPRAKVKSDEIEYRVQSGDTFYGIARKHHLPMDRLIAANPKVQPSALRVGQIIRIPQTTTPAEANASPAAAELESISETQPAAQGTGTRRHVGTHMVEGEMSFGAFAAKHGTTPERLNQLNGLDLDARTILAKGSELFVPSRH